MNTYSSEDHRQQVSLTYNKITDETIDRWDEFRAITARLDQLEDNMNRILNEINDMNKPKDLPLDEFFSTFCTLKAWDGSHPRANGYKSVLNQFYKFLNMKHPSVKNLN